MPPEIKEKGVLFLFSSLHAFEKKKKPKPVFKLNIKVEDEW